MFDLTVSQNLARRRLERHSSRRRRSDAGQSRLPPEVLEGLRAVVRGSDRPSMADVQHHIAKVCAERGLNLPSRASLYNALARIEGHSHDISRLPSSVREALYNLAPDGSVPGHQLAFYCLNYGSMAAVSYAAGLPWLDLYQASRLRGWRPRSRGLLHAVMAARGLR
jgi:hypothetical protein